MEEKDLYLSKDRFAKHAGKVLTEVKPGYAKAQMKIKDFHMNSVNLVQGGAIFTLADYAFAAAANAYGRVALGVNVNISFLKAGISGTLYAECKEISKSYKLANYTVTVTDDDGDKVALFNGIVYLKS